MARKNHKKASELSSFGRRVLDAVHDANHNAAETTSRQAQSEAHHYQSYPANYNGPNNINNNHAHYQHLPNPNCPTNNRAQYQYPHYNHSYHAAISAVDGHQQRHMEYNNQYVNAAYGAGYGYPPGYNAQNAQQQQQYQAPPPPPQIRNPFAPPPPPASAYAAQNANFDPDYEQQLAQWNSAYAPADQQVHGKKAGKHEQSSNTGYGSTGQRNTATGTGATEAADGKSRNNEDSKFTVVRKGGGEAWEDNTLLDWDPKQFRIMVGNLAGEVTDDSLTKAFAGYGVSRARVVRDKRTTKSRGYGFVAFTDHDQGFKAAREMAGKYIGSHPVTIKRSKTNVQPVMKKDQNKHKGKDKQHHKNNKDQKAEKDPLRANTQAGIEKKQPSKTNAGLKLLG